MKEVGILKHIFSIKFRDLEAVYVFAYSYNKFNNTP